MAAVASRTLASMASVRRAGSGSPAAPTTQWPMCSSTSPKAHGVQGLGGRGDLGQDVDAVFVLIHHPGDPADLALDALEPAQVCLFVGGVAMRRRRVSAGVCWSTVSCDRFIAANIYPMGVYGKYPLGVSNSEMGRHEVGWVRLWARTKSSGVRYWGIRTPEQHLGRFTRPLAGRILLLELAYLPVQPSATTSNNYFRFIISVTRKPPEWGEAAGSANGSGIVLMRRPPVGNHQHRPALMVRQPESD